MPYMKVKRGKKVFVYKRGADGKPQGEALGEHDSEAAADRQIAAILARTHSGKALTEDELKAGNIGNLAQHLANKYGGDPKFFTKCMAADELADYGEDTRAAICARAHHLVVGIWPGEHGREGKSVNLDEQARTVREAWDAQFRNDATAPAPVAVQGPPGYVKEVFDDHVIVERGTELYSYPYTRGEDGTIAFGEPTKVEVEYVAAKMVDLAAIGGELKALGADGHVGGYLVRFGGPQERDLVGDYFTPETEFMWAGQETRPALYHHGLDPTLGGKTLGDGLRLGRVDQVGLWVETQLDLRDDYEKAVFQLAQKGKLGLSSGTANHMIQKAADGRILRWPIVEGSFTPTPMEPRTALVSLKSIQSIPLGSLTQALLDQSGDSTGGRVGAPGDGGGRAGGQIKAIVRHAAVKGASKMDLLEMIKKLVPGLTDEQYEQIGAVLALAGLAKAAEATEPAADGQGVTESAAGGQAIRGVDPKQLNEAVLAAVKALGITPPAPAAAGSATSRPPYAFKPEPNQPADGEQPAMKAIAQLHFGETPAAVKAVARDLYGDEYELKRVRQHQAFGRFLRVGERGLSGEMLKALHEIVLTPGQIKAMVLQGVEVAAIKTDLSSAVDSLGGFTTPEDFRTDMIERLPGLTVVRPRADVSPTSSDVMTKVKVTGGDDRHVSPMRVTWVGDTPADNQAVTNPTFGVEKTPIHIAMCTVRVPVTLLEDTVFPLTQKISEWAAGEYSLDEDEQFLVGNGIAKPQGILPGSANGLSLAEVVSGAAATLTSDGLMGLRYGVARQYRSNAVWIMNDATAAIVSKMKDGEGRYMWEPSMQAGEPDRLLGYPLLTDEAMPDVAASAYPIIFGDLKGYQIADRVGMSVIRDDVTLAEQGLVKFVFRRRLGGQVAREWAFAVQKVAAS